MDSLPSALLVSVGQSSKAGNGDVINNDYAHVLDYLDCRFESIKDWLAGIDRGNSVAGYSNSFSSKAGKFESASAIRWRVKWLS